MPSRGDDREADVIPLKPQLLEVRDLVVRFTTTGRGRRQGRSVVQAVAGVSFDVAAGETVGLVGESGSGKSTTARAILQLIPATSGTVHFEGIDVMSKDKAARRHLRRGAQMVFQDPYASLNQRMNVEAIVREPLDIHQIGTTLTRNRLVSAMLDRVGLPADAGKRYPSEFSGGQRQRIGIARALAIEPALIVCDEPVTALDVSIQAQVLQLLADLQRDLHVAYLFIAHDLNVVRHVSRRAAVMYLGRIVEYGDARELFDNPRHPYTKALLSAVPIANPDQERTRKRVLLQGEIPDPTDPPSGCRFRTRCPFARAKCAEDEPLLEDAGSGLFVACHFWREIGDSAPPPDPGGAITRAQE